MDLWRRARNEERAYALAVVGTGLLATGVAVMFWAPAWLVLLIVLVTIGWALGFLWLSPGRREGGNR